MIKVTNNEVTFNGNRSSLVAEFAHIAKSLTEETEITADELKEAIDMSQMSTKQLLKVLIKEVNNFIDNCEDFELEFYDED